VCIADVGDRVQRVGMLAELGHRIRIGPRGRRIT
jgi:hypothetical protein